MATQTPSIQSFVPAQLLRWLADRPMHDEPASRTQEMAVLFADLSDFSSLTLDITERQRAGPEKVTELLDNTFSTIVETIRRYGGEVLGFAGDSVLATWTLGESLARSDAVALASSCGLEVQGLTLPAAERPLRLRIGIGVGPGVLVRVGGVDGQWHFAIGGPPFDQIGRTAAKADRGEVVLSWEAREAIESSSHGQQLEDGSYRLTGVDPVTMPDPVPLPELGDEMAAEVRSFVSYPVVTRLDSGHAEWLAEFRRVTSVFVNLPSLDVSNPSERESLQSVVWATQEWLAAYEGTLSRILVDEKGVTLMASFGIPPLAHEDDPDRAITASLKLQEKLKSMRLDYGIGVATGRAYCGAVGGDELRQYTTIGAKVNLAARLMQQAKFDIQCDEDTARSARRTDFYPLGPRDVRGWDEPIDVYRPLWDAAEIRSEGPLRPLLGRDRERAQLMIELKSLDQTRQSAVVVVEGGAGMGKSALAEDFVDQAKSLDVQILSGRALPIAQDPYHAWREVISEVLGLAGMRAIEKRQEIVQEKLSKWPRFGEWQSLLNSVLDVEFPETESTRGMSGRNRHQSTVELLITLLTEAAVEKPLVVVLDDLHWFDSASWALTLAVVRNVSPVLIVLLTRPMREQGKTMEELAAIASPTRIELQPISSQNALELAKERLGAQELEPDVADVIVKGAEGIPFFVEELAYSLRDTDALIFEDGTVRLNKPAEELDVPHSLSSVVLSRIDQLAPEPQLTVKVASVIGRSFDVEELAAVHPSGTEPIALKQELSNLVSLELITESSSSPGSYDFKHALIRDAAYDLLLFEQRRKIHANVATFFESEGDHRAEPPYGLLAYHWDRAENSQKALTYMEITGASALRKGANREAIDAHSRSLELIGQHPGEFANVSPLRRSQWHVEIGQAHEALGEFDAAEKSFFRALDLAGVHVSTSAWRRVGRLMWEATKQTLHIALPRAIRVPRADGEKARLGQAARVAALIGEIYYFTSNLLGFPVMNLVAINLGEKAGQPVVAGLAYSSLGYLVGTLRLRRLARRYFQRARIAEDFELDRGFVEPLYVPELAEMGPGHLIAVALAESVLALTFNDLDAARDIVTEGLERTDRFGDKYSAGIALAVRGFGSYCAGNLEGARSDYLLLHSSARERSNREHEGWATSLVIPILLALDRLSEAQDMADKATAIVEDVDPLTVPIIHGTRSQVELRTGQLGKAQSSAELALEAFDSTPIFIYLAGFAGMLDTFLELWAMESDPTSRKAKDLARLTKKGLKTMRSFALVLPFARPKYRLFKGRVDQLQSRTARAQRSFRRGLELAERSGFTWDEGLLHLELARTFPAHSPERQAQLTAAQKRFEESGSLHDLNRTIALNDD